MGDISEATRERVLQASQRLGYRPSRFARNLVDRNKTHAVGLVVASFVNPYFTDIAGDMIAGAMDRGWQLIMAPGDADRPTVLDLLSRQVDVIVGHFGGDDEALIAESNNTPIIKLEDKAHIRGVHAVQIDIEAGIRIAVDELAARGARRFGMVDSGYTRRGGNAYEPSPRRRYFENQVGSRLSAVVVGDETISGGGAAFLQLMESHPDTDAVIMFNDLMALGAVQTAQARGLDVPSGVRIMGIDGLALGEAVNPQLTSIALDRHALATNALEIAETIAADDFAPREPINILLEPRILWRDSA
jgi:LacI family transcriptional regulator